MCIKQNIRKATWNSRILEEKSENRIIISGNEFLQHGLNNYRQVSNIRHTLVGNRTVDHSDVIRALPVGTTPTTSSFST